MSGKASSKRMQALLDREATKEEQRFKRVAALLRKVVAKRARAKRTMDPLQRAKLLAEAAELEVKAAKVRAEK